MNEFSDREIWLVVLLAFAAGYILVSFLARLMKTEPLPEQSNKIDPAFSKYGQVLTNFESRGDPISAEVDDVSVSLPGTERSDEEYARLLGLSQITTATELDQAYHRALVKCHPGNVAQLDEAFQRLARQRTREVEEAYAYLKRRQGRS